MKAVVQNEYGDSSVLHLEDVPVPTIGDDDVLIEVRATSLNIGDVHLMTGLPLIMRPLSGGAVPERISAVEAGCSKSAMRQLMLRNKMIGRSLVPTRPQSTNVLRPALRFRSP